ELTVARLEDGGHVRACQPFADAVIGEAVAVEEREPFDGAEPEIAAGVANDAVDDVVRQTVGDGIGAQRQPLRPRPDAACDHQDRDEEGPHREAEVTATSVPDQTRCGRTEALSAEVRRSRGGRRASDAVRGRAAWAG